MPIEINWKLKESRKFKKGSYWDIISKYLPAFINVLENINKLIVLYHPTPSPILEMSAILGE